MSRDGNRSHPYPRTRKWQQRTDQRADHSRGSEHDAQLLAVEHHLKASVGLHREVHAPQTGVGAPGKAEKEGGCHDGQPADGGGKKSAPQQGECVANSASDIGAGIATLVIVDSSLRRLCFCLSLGDQVEERVPQSR